LGGTESSQAMGSKYKKVTSEDKEKQQPSKKTKEVTRKVPQECYSQDEEC